MSVFLLWDTFPTFRFLHLLTHNFFVLFAGRNMSICLRAIFLILFIVIVIAITVPRNSSICAKACRENSIPSFSKVQRGQRLLHITEGCPNFIQVERLKKITDQFTDLYISYDLFDRKPCPLDSWVTWSRFLSASHTGAKPISQG